MCGRFVSVAPPDEVARYFDAEPPTDVALGPRYNVAPTDDVYVVLSEGGVRRVAPHHWGLVPFWAKGPAVGNKMINARSEGLADKGAFKHAFARRRCIVPADGFYEWQAVAGQKAKQPYFIHRADGELLGFAGLWEEWRQPGNDGSPRLRSATILTTTANATVEPLHDRMPVILGRSDWAGWLDPTDTDLEALGGLLAPAPPQLLTMHPVSTDVGNVRNEGAHLVDPVEVTTAETLLG